jgi:hypothetical protein
MISADEVRRLNIALNGGASSEGESFKRLAAMPEAQKPNVEHASMRKDVNLEVKGKDRTDFRKRIVNFAGRLIDVDVGLARELLYFLVNADPNSRDYLAQALCDWIEIAETGSTS